jgi:hypothetical protein
MTRPVPITVHLADGAARKFYETMEMDRFLAELALKVDRIQREAEYWKLLALSK